MGRLKMLFSVEESLLGKPCRTNVDEGTYVTQENGHSSGERREAKVATETDAAGRRMSAQTLVKVARKESVT